jgi:serine kinase of HPr protein (carbohydrate metabolism regulator)
MTIREAADALGAEIVQNEFDDTELSGAYTSDLLSDVMAHARANDAGALITIQAHKNTVAVATLLDMSAIIICNSRPILEDMIAAAKDEGIAVMRTGENQYTVSGKLYALLN